jgi:hypothetical protein
MIAQPIKIKVDPIMDLILDYTTKLNLIFTIWLVGSWINS